MGNGSSMCVNKDSVAVIDGTQEIQAKVTTVKVKPAAETPTANVAKVDNSSADKPKTSAAPSNNNAANTIPINIREHGELNFPDLSQHNNWMAKCLTPQMYKKLYALKTPNGVTIDDIIQTGVDNPGHPFIYTVGCVAGDEESYSVFSDFFDQIIYNRHNKYDASQKHVTDLNPDKLVGGGNLDPKYVLSCRVRTGRSIRGYALPPVCTRAERKAVEGILVKPLLNWTANLKENTTH